MGPTATRGLTAPMALRWTGGNLYVADTGNNTIRKLTPSGTNWVVSTIAGLAGSSGSTDGTNSNSRFRYPIGIAVDSGGNLYVTDEGNNTIRKLTLSGTNWVTSTLAGLAGNSGSTDGTNSSARFNEPYGIAVDGGGNLYVADKYCSTIRKLKQVGVNWMVSTIAGLPYNTGGTDGLGSAARFNNPTGIAVDGGGNLYVADEGNNTIRRLALAGTNWVVFTAAGLAGSSGSADGLGSAARFNGPYAIAVDGNTNVYVADSGNSIIRGTLPGDTAFDVGRSNGKANNRQHIRAYLECGDWTYISGAIQDQFAPNGLEPVDQCHGVQFDGQCIHSGWAGSTAVLSHRSVAIIHIRHAF